MNQHLKGYTIIKITHRVVEYYYSSDSFLWEPPLFLYYYTKLFKPLKFLVEKEKLKWISTFSKIKFSFTILIKLKL